MEKCHAQDSGRCWWTLCPVQDAKHCPLPPQRSMTPEESANLAAYHKTKFKRVPAQDDGLRELIEQMKGSSSLPAAHILRTYAPKLEEALAAHDAALRASVREELLKQGLFMPFGTCKVSSKSHIVGNCCPCEGWTALASEKAAPEEVAQASNELGTCDILSEPHETGFTYSPTHLHLCSNWRPLPKGDAK